MSWRRLLPLLLVLSVACFSAKDDDDDDDDDDGSDSGLVTDDTGASGDDTGGGGGDEGGGDEGGGDEGGGDEGGGDEGGGDEGGGDEGGGDEGGGDGGGDPVGLCATGEAWALDFSSGVFVEPAGVGELVVEEMDNTLLLGLTEATSSRAVLVVGVTDGVEQDTCVPTAELEGSWTDPRFSVGPDDITLRALGHDIRAYDAALSGTLTEDCASLEDVTFEALLDLRDTVDIIADLLGISGVEEVCATITGFGMSCVSCPDGSPYCADVAVEGLDAAGISDPILPRTESQVLASGTCGGVGQGCESAPTPERRAPLLPLVVLSGLAVVGLRRR